MTQKGHFMAREVLGLICGHNIIYSFYPVFFQCKMQKQSQTSVLPCYTLVCTEATLSNFYLFT